MTVVPSVTVAIFCQSGPSLGTQSTRARSEQSSLWQSCLWQSCLWQSCLWQSWRPDLTCQTSATTAPRTVAFAISKPQHRQRSFIVPSGPLTSLPLNVLVPEPPKASPQTARPDPHGSPVDDTSHHARRIEN